MKRWVVRLTSTSAVAVGSSRARGFHVPTYPYIPGGTLRGALAGSWISTYGSPDEHMRDFVTEVVDLRVGPALSETATQVPLDRLVCKYAPQPRCEQVAVVDEGVVGKCPNCGGRMERSKGQWIGVQVERTTRTRLTVEETPESGNLFSRAALAPEQTFVAHAWGDLGWLTNVSSLRVGGRRTVGGQMSVTVEQIDAVPTTVVGRTLRLRCLAPAVFLDGFGATQIQPTPLDLGRAFDCAPAAAPRLSRSWVRPTTVGGWHGAGGLPKVTEVAATGGSVFELAFDREVTAADVERVEQVGIGVRRMDGYGWVSAQPWHMPTQASEEVVSTDYQRIKRIAEHVATFDTPFVRRCLGWLRSAVTTGDVARAAAYTDLTPQARSACDAVLTFNGPNVSPDEKRAMAIALEVRT